ncbi:MAG: PEP-CTERM sorting domain-containing protein [Terrimicrobiaceae bacterium]
MKELGSHSSTPGQCREKSDSIPCQLARPIRVTLLTLIAVLLGHVGAFSQNLTVKFDTQYLGTFPSPGNSTYGVWSNGPTVSDTNIYVSFQGSAAGNFTASIAGQTLAYSTTTTHWTYGNTTYTHVMSPSFTVSQLNQGGSGFSISEINGQNMYIEYGTNTINATFPPGPTASIRYTDVEFTYVPGSTYNNADLTAINNIGSALKLQYAGTTTNNTASVGFTGYTSDMLPYLASQQAPANVVSATTATSPPPPSAGGNGSFVAGVLGASYIAQGTGFYEEYPTVIANAVSGNLSTPLLTNRPGGENPTSHDYVQSQGFTGTISSISANATNYLVSTSFKPSFSSSANNTYQITFTGTVTAVTPGFSGNSTDILTYGSESSPLTITVAGGTESFYGYLSTGNVGLPGVIVTLGGNSTAWDAFSTDFYNGGSSGGGGNGSQGGPDSTIASGGNGSQSAPYGQIVQRVLGDFQELAMVGAFGNTSNGTGNFTTTQIGDIPSWNIFQDKSYAYNTTATDGFNPIGKYLWLNSENVTNGVPSVGAIYSNPYDDRFGNNGVSIPMDQYGGVLTVQLREITPVPEPSTIALLSLAAGALFFLARRRRRQT